MSRAGHGLIGVNRSRVRLKWTGSLGTVGSPTRWMSEAAEEEKTPTLMNTKTHANLKSAFVAKSMAYMRAKYYESIADLEGDGDAAVAFQTAANAAKAQALSFMDTLEECGDPATDSPIGDSSSNLAEMSNSLRDEGTRIFPEFAKAAKEEGFEDIADWLDRTGEASVRSAEVLATHIPLGHGTE